MIAFVYLIDFMELVLGWKDLIYLGSNLIGLTFLFLTYGVIIAFLIDFGNFIFLPALYRTGNIADLLFAPLTFLYI